MTKQKADPTGLLRYDIDRFFSKTAVGDLESCWIWQASKTGPYGKFQELTRTQHGEEKYEYAHRMAYKFANGEIPEGKHILHACGTHLCVNPLHLYAGDPQQNSDDRERHGRNSGGRPSKLTLDQIDTIYRLAEEGETKEAISRMFHITPQYVGQIVNHGLLRGKK